MSKCLEKLNISSLEQMREKRRNWVASNRDNGFDEGINNLLTQLYPDNAHFIYELLQNAEDTRATIVRFTLNDSAVEFEHNGEKLFSLEDICSITSICNSTKGDEPTSIGKFGVGFKAVFAYTNTPEIHSGDFHFCIHDLVVPETEGVPHHKMGDRETRFAFPFDNPKKPKQQAVEEVERGLRALGDNTLLFLSHISRIEYRLPDDSWGSLERFDQNSGRIEIHTSQPGGEKTISHWLRFEKDVKVNEDGKFKTCRIAIAYSLVEEDDRKKPPVWKVVPLDSGQVSIYFPAESEKSNLRFHIHAPFASTVARDSVRDSGANYQLRDHIADLVVESIVSIREQGFLTVGYLAALPNHADPLTPFYQPIRNAIIRSFKDDALTPTRSGSHAPATGLYRGPAEISAVLDDDDLSLLTGFAPPLWAANTRQQNQREDREDQFLKSLDIEDWGWSELSSAVSELDDDERQNIEGWIIQKDDAWLMSFYALLGEACDSHYACADVGELLLVRIETAQGFEHVAPKKAFFPPDDGMLLPDILYVKASVFRTGTSESQNKYSESFLKQVGVRPFDEKAVIELSLEQFSQPPEQVRPSYFINVNNFITHWKKNPNDAGLFRARNFLRGVSIDGNVHWRKPTQLCLDNPYEETGLAAFAKIHAKDAIWDGYKEKLTESQLKDFIDFLKAIGVMHELKVERIKIKGNSHERQLRNHFNWGRALIQTHTATDEDYSISGIERYLATESILASRLVWNAFVYADRKSATARYRPNQQHGIKEAESQLVCILKQHAWIPNKAGIFRKAEEMSTDELRTDFPYDDRNGLLTAIDFGARAKVRSEEYRTRNEVAKAAGLGSAEELDKWKKVRDTGISPDEILAQQAQRQRVAQPEDSVRGDPVTRQKKVLANTADAPSKESVMLERSIQKGIFEVTAQARAYLRTKCKNADGQLVCQCCYEEMPFKLPTGEYYFEAVQCIGDKETRHFQNRLALCPTCAAMYQYARETDDAEIRRSIVENKSPDNAASVEIPVRLAGRQFQLRFVGTHWFDLKTVLSQFYTA